MSISEQDGHREVPQDAGAQDPVFLNAGEGDHWLNHEIHPDGPRATSAGNRRRKPFRLFRFIRRLIMLVILLIICLAGALSLSAYLGRHWIQSQVEHRLTYELARQDIHLAYDSASYHFTRGLLLKNAKLFESEKREKLLVTCTEVGFTFDVVDLAQKEFQGGASTAFTAHKAELAFYEEGELLATLQDVDGAVYGGDQNVTVNRISGRIGDLDFDFEGVVAISREERRQSKVRKKAAAAEAGTTRKIANFAFFREVLPWLAVTSNVEGTRPELRGSFLVDPKNENPVTVKGRFNGRKFSWRDIPFDSATIEFGFAEGDRRLRLPDFNLNYEGGLIAGEAVWDSSTGDVNVGRFQSSADILSLLRQINPEIAPFSAMIDQEEPPLVRASGLLKLKDFWNSDLSVDYRHASGVTLLLDRGDLRIEGIDGRLRIEEGGLNADSLVLSMLGGRVKAAGRLDMLGSGIRYQGRFDATGMPIQEVMDYFGSERELPGLLSMSFEGSGGAAMVDLNGAGNVRIDAAKLYKVPVIGPVQNLMGTVVPVFGSDQRSEMTASFQIQDGVLSSEDLVVVSDGTEVELVGTVDLSSWQTNFEAEGKLVGALGLVTGLLTKALVVEGAGRIDELDLRMKNVPAEFASETVKGIFGVAGKGLNIVTDTLGTAQDVAGGALKATGAVISGGADKVRNVGQKTLGGGARAVGSGASAIGGGIGDGAKMVGEGAKRLGKGILKIIPGQQGSEKDDPPMIMGPPDPGELEIVEKPDPEKKERRSLRSLAPIFSD